MSTPEAAWPEPFVEVVARVIGPDESGELVIDSLCGAMELTRMVLEAAVAWRDPKGEPAVVRAEEFFEQIHIWNTAHRREWERANALEVEHDEWIGRYEEMRLRAETAEAERDEAKNDHRIVAGWLRKAEAERDALRERVVAVSESGTPEAAWPEGLIRWHFGRSSGPRASGRWYSWPVAAEGDE